MNMTVLLVVASAGGLIGVGWEASKEVGVWRRIGQGMVLIGCITLLALAITAFLPTEKKDMVDCKEDVLEFEKRILALDQRVNEGYQPFTKACAQLSLQGIRNTIHEAIQILEEGNREAWHIQIPNNIPLELSETLRSVRETIATVYFAKGKLAENILNTLTGEGEQYSTSKKLLFESEKLTIQAGLTLARAKVMVGITE